MPREARVDLPERFKKELLCDFIKKCYNCLVKYQVFTKKQFLDRKVTLKPADFIIVHGSDLFDKLIQLFTSSRWNHAALVVDKNGKLIELVTSGIQKNHIVKYETEDFKVVRIYFDPLDAKQVLDYAKVMLKRHETYGFLTIATIVFKIIAKSHLIVKLDGTMICSEFIANALSEGGVIWSKDASLITPADLAKRFF